MKDVFPWCTSLWAVRLQTRQGAPGDSAELAAGSSHPRGEEAGLLAALGWGLLLGAMNTFGLLCTLAAQSKFSKTHRYLQSKTLWLACSSYTLGKVKDWEESAPGPQWVGKTGLPERRDLGQLEAVAGAAWCIRHSSPGLAFGLLPRVRNPGEESSSGSLWISCDVTYTPGLSEHLYKFQKTYLKANIL